MMAVYFGTIGNDALEGGTGNDFLSGEAGNDVLDGGAGNDWFSGGSDCDVYRFGNSDPAVNQDDLGQDTIAGSADNYQDVIQLRNIAGLYGADKIDNDLRLNFTNPDQGGSINSITLQDWFAGAGYQIQTVSNLRDNTTTSFLLRVGTESDDSIAFDDAGAKLVFGLAGNDTIHGSAGICALYGGAGNDLLTAGEFSHTDFDSFWAKYRQYITPAEPHRFNIELDYRFDTTGFWTPERRAAAEYAANAWESIITDDFATTPAGTQVTLLWDDPDATGYQCIEQTITLDHDVDDMIIFMRGNTYPGAASFKLVDNSAVVHERYTGAEAFQPIASAIDFNINGSWWIDPTPLNNNDDAANLISATDLITVLEHEMGHSLGLVDRWLRSYMGGSIQSVSKNVVSIAGNDYFNGPNAVAVYGGPVPLDMVGHVVTADYLSVMESQPTVSSPGPSALDAAILKDIGYHTS